MRGNVHCVYYPGEPVPRAGASCLELMFVISWLQGHCLKSLKSILKVAFDKKNYRQPRNPGSGRNSLPKERAP